MRKDSGFDIEWRLFSQLSKRMVKSYKHNLRKSEEVEWFSRCRLIVDYIAGMTDQSALRFYQNAMGISLSWGTWSIHSKCLDVKRLCLKMGRKSVLKASFAI